MFRVVPRAEQHVSANGSVRFEGEPYGSAVSFFLVDNEPGEGPALHVHPYPETWVVRSGHALMRAGSESAEVGPGDIIVVSAGTPHAFRNIGPGRLEMVCIHAGGRILQQWVEPVAATGDE